MARAAPGVCHAKKEHLVMRNTHLGLILAASAVTLCCVAREPRGIAAVPADAVHPPGAMTVTGTATLEVSPDCLDLTMTIIADGDRPGLATRALRAEEAAVIAALAKIGVAGNDLKLSLLTLNPIYDPSPSGWAQLHVHTYRAEITLTATTHRFDKLGDMIVADVERVPAQRSAGAEEEGARPGGGRGAGEGQAAHGRRRGQARPHREHR
jgi:uncharacterized protein YggE